ncbi:MAG: phosphotransferase family protein, partial [Chloroflexota bacterium]
MNVDLIAGLLTQRAPCLAGTSIEAAGEGDYCQAYAVNDEWIFLVAKHAEAARSLMRVAALLPALAPTLPLAIPEIVYAGEGTGLDPAFVGYRKIPGVELTADRLNALPVEDQERCAADLAAFLREIHRFPVDLARQAGIPVCAYPFAATEDGMTDGTAEEQYRRDLDRILSYSLLDQGTRDFCQRIMGQHLKELQSEAISLTLLHGEVSQDHVLFDPTTRRITGVIDFNGVVIGDPVRDLLYLYEDYGPAFLAAFLDHDPITDRPRLLAKLHFFHEWHTALRLLWALDHRYAPAIAHRL